MLRTIGRINNPRSAWLFDKTFHVDVAVNQAAIMSSLIEEEMSWGDMTTLLKLRRGQYSLVEEKIPEGAKVVGRALKDIQFPDECVIAAIIRKGEIVLPRGVTEFEVGDEVLAVVGPERARRVSEICLPRRRSDARPARMDCCVGRAWALPTFFVGLTRRMTEFINYSFS